MPFQACSFSFKQSFSALGELRQEVTDLPSTHKGCFVWLLGWFCVFLFDGLGKVVIELEYGRRNLEQVY